MGGRADGRASGYTCGESREELHKHAHRDDDEVDGWTGWAAGQDVISICPSLTQTITVKPKWEGERGKGGDLDPRWEKNALRTNVDPEPDL